MTNFVNRYEVPRLVFKPVEGRRLTLEFSAAYYPGCFTMTGVRDHHIEPIVEWCKTNNCGRRSAYNYFVFESKKHLTMFLLRWNDVEMD